MRQEGCQIIVTQIPQLSLILNQPLPHICLFSMINFRRLKGSAVHVSIELEKNGASRSAGKWGKGRRGNMLTLKRRLVSASLIFAFLFTGCAQTRTINTSDKPAAESVSTIKIPELTEETTAESTPANVPFTFNPHVSSCFIDALYSKEYKESFFNLVDALSEGKDTFKCTDQKVYEFCMDPVTLNQLYPVACMQITGKGKDGSKPFENGIGRIYYSQSAEAFLTRQKQFRQDVTDIMNKYIKSDYSDYEKCLALYDYISSNYTYDHKGEVGKTKDGSSYTCFTLKKGICCDFGAWYAYLLMQCGVNAIEVQNFGTDESLGYHAWTFVEINGKTYHIDPTWSLKSETGNDGLQMDYFLMSDEDRAGSGYPADLLQVPMSTYFYAKDCKEYKFVANDVTFRLPSGSTCVRYDTDKNIVYYHTSEDDQKEYEFKYA